MNSLTILQPGQEVAVNLPEPAEDGNPWAKEAHTHKMIQTSGHGRSRENMDVDDLFI